MGGSREECCQLNVCAPPQIHVLKPNPWSDSIRRWGFGDKIRPWGWSPHEWDYHPLKRQSQMFKLILEKAEEPEIKLPTSAWSWKRQESSRKTSISALFTITMPKPLTMWITINWKILKQMEYQTTWPASWETCMQVRKEQLEQDMEQHTGSK